MVIFREVFVGVPASARICRRGGTGSVLAMRERIAAYPPHLKRSALSLCFQFQAIGLDDFLAFQFLPLILLFVIGLGGMSHK